MNMLPTPFTSWSKFHQAMRNLFEHDATDGPVYEGNAYTWGYLERMEADEIEQRVVVSTTKTFDFPEGKLEIKYSLEVNQGDKFIQLTGFFEPGKYKTGECWITEQFESAEAAKRGFNSFSQSDAEYMMRRLLSSYSSTPDNY